MEFELEEFNYNEEQAKKDIEDNVEEDNLTIQIAGYQRKDILCLKKLSEECNFLIVNDMFLWKDAFQIYYEDESVGFCPLNKYRPPQATYVQNKFGYTVHEESYNGFTNTDELECICKILESLQLNKAYQVAQFIRSNILPKQRVNQIIQQDIRKYYNFNDESITAILDNNFNRSLSMAHSFLANLSENPNKIIKHQIKRFCFETMSHKIYSNGGSLGFAKLIQGEYTFITKKYKNLLEFLMFYCRNIQLPEVLDQRGLIDINIALITGQTEIDINLITIEGFRIMGKAKIISYPLSEVTLVNGFRAVDYLVSVEFVFNPKVLEELNNKRKEIDQKLLDGTLDYNPFIDEFYSEEKIERITREYQFMQKFYPKEFDKMIANTHNSSKTSLIDNKINTKVLNEVQHKLIEQQEQNNKNLNEYPDQYLPLDCSQHQIQPVNQEQQELQLDNNKVNDDTINQLFDLQSTNQSSSHLQITNQNLYQQMVTDSQVFSQQYYDDEFYSHQQTNNIINDYSNNYNQYYHLYNSPVSN